MKDETLLPNDLIHMAISAIDDLLDHCDPSTDHYCGVWADVPDKLRAALQSGNSGQPAGYVMVPVEPTPEMCDVGHIGIDVLTGVTSDSEYYSTWGDSAAKLYRAMTPHFMHGSYGMYHFLPSCIAL